MFQRVKPRGSKGRGVTRPCAQGRARGRKRTHMYPMQRTINAQATPKPTSAPRVNSLSSVLSACSFPPTSFARYEITTGTLSTWMPNKSVAAAVVLVAAIMLIMTDS
eukprot:6173465-Pleurochrysis_carterae.AAC.5